ncbi:hypothetical protein [Andreprevotia chitinilytica]|uniref:hypothetical protein n=1 Tax=Andreprevotia chitinilytica TaxID=396808 RepID=UPI00055207B4|nr:hypothetical protein [Andreprevotia chitinilytica]
MRLILLCFGFVATLAYADGIVLASNGDTSPSFTALQTVSEGQSMQLTAGSCLAIADLRRGKFYRWTGPCETTLAALTCSTRLLPLPDPLRTALQHLPKTFATITSFDDTLPSRTISPQLAKASQQASQFRKQYGNDSILPLLYLLDAQVSAKDGLGLQDTLNALALAMPDNKQIGALLAHVRRLGLVVGTPASGPQVEVHPLEMR